MFVYTNYKCFSIPYAVPFNKRWHFLFYYLLVSKNKTKTKNTERVDKDNHNLFIQFANIIITKKPNKSPLRSDTESYQTELKLDHSEKFENQYSTEMSYEITVYNI